MTSLNKNFTETLISVGLSREGEFSVKNNNNKNILEVLKALLGLYSNPYYVSNEFGRDQTLESEVDFQTTYHETLAKTIEKVLKQLDWQQDSSFLKQTIAELFRSAMIDIKNENHPLTQHINGIFRDFPLSLSTLVEEKKHPLFTKAGEKLEAATASDVLETPLSSQLDVSATRK